QSSVRGQKTPECHGPQAGMQLLGELDDLGGLVDDHHGETQENEATSQPGQGLDRLVHQRRSRCRPSGTGTKNERTRPARYLCVRSRRVIYCRGAVSRFARGSSRGRQRYKVYSKSPASARCDRKKRSDGEAAPGGRVLGGVIGVEPYVLGR